MRINRILFTLLLSVSPLSQVVFAQDAPPLTPDGHGIIFRIGAEDKSRNEFKAADWTGIDEFRCTAGIDCDAASFPTRLSAEHVADRHAMTTVQRAVIVFNLAEAQSNLVLRVARFGVEKSVVRLDDGMPITVTKEMMDPPSSEDIWGRFELPLGAVSAGIHQIELSVLNEIAGTGRHSLDAITLYSADAQ